nr:reverse transcriptase domain-containing protein [Tanacetum cinerariifolium]
MVNVIPSEYVDVVHVVEPNQHDDVPVVLERVLVAKDKDPEEEDFKDEEETQEKEDDMEFDIKENENEPELTYPYEEVDPLNPLLPASDSEPRDVIEVENMIEFEDETVPASVHDVGELSTTPFLREDSDGLLHGLMRRDINSLFVRCLLFQDDCVVTRWRMHWSKRKETQRTSIMKLVKNLGNVEDKAERKKLKKELEESRSSNTLLRMQNERVKRDLYWTRFQAHEFYYEMIRTGYVFEEDRIKLSMFWLKMRRVHHLSGEDLLVILSSLVSIVVSLLIMPPKSALLTQVAIRRMIKESDAAPIVCENTFARFMKCNPTSFHGTERAVELRRWFEKTESVLGSVNVQRERRKVGHKARYCKEKNVAKGANAQQILTCYDCGDQGHTRNRCPRKVKQKETREVRGRAYAIKDAELQGCTLNLVNHIFEIDLMPIELGTFDVIIGMDWLVKHDAVIICGEKVVRIPYGNKMLIVKSDKGVSRLKVISCIKA